LRLFLLHAEKEDGCQPEKKAVRCRIHWRRVREKTRHAVPLYVRWKKTVFCFLKNLDRSFKASRERKGRTVGPERPCSSGIHRGNLPPVVPTKGKKGSMVSVLGYVEKRKKEGRA